AAIKEPRGQRHPRCRFQIALVIDRGPLKQRTRRPDKSILVRIVYLPLVIVSENNFVLPPIGYLPIDVRTNEPPFREEVINWSRIKDRVGVSRVTQRVSEQTTYPQLFVRRPTHVRNSGGIAVIVVWTRIVGIEPTCTNRIVEVVDLAIALQPFAKR